MYTRGRVRWREGRKEAEERGSRNDEKGQKT